ncbi:MAG: hypothetical protein ACXWPM_06130 [Bdellovibrionota bacterium]
MSQILINGVPKELPVSVDRPFQELLNYLRQHYLMDEETLISSMRINGREISDESDEKLLGELPIADIGPIEIFTSHPREIAEETLTTLVEFSRGLAGVSRAVAAHVMEEGFNWDLTKLLEGLTSFSDAMLMVRQIMRIGVMPEINVLDAELTSVLRDIVVSQERRDPLYLKDLLGEHLPKVLEDWAKDGIPFIQRARSS